ncbi:MAG TPA: O-antigen ligase family protein [Ktedonobacterales bacterium]|nr:O-antigen ligase family protein [Ktedonobacterales bacterium]
MTVMRPLAPEEQMSPGIAGLSRQTKRATSGIYVAMLLCTVALVPFMLYMGSRYGTALVLSGLAAVVLMALTVRAPIFGFYTLAFAAVVIEQNPLTMPIGTDKLYIFSWPGRLSGLPERPIGFYMLALILIFSAIRLATRKGPAVRGGEMLWPFLAFLACVVMGIVHGLATGGNFRIIVLEVRPFWYLFATYLVAYNLVSEKRHIMTFLWILVIGTFVKALQGCYLVIVELHGHISGGANEIMAHEQSYFFVLVLLLVLLAILTKRMRALMWVAVASLPFLIIALLANNRRADYLAFVLGAVAVWLLAIATEKPRRKQLITSFITCVVVMSLYIVVFGVILGKTHTPISEPAVSVISVIHPSQTDARDLASNLYRYFEDADLQFTEKQNPILGYGFGKPFLQPDPLPNILALDPYYLYIPHNNVLWIWMRLGPLGYLAFWYLFGSAIVRAGAIMKRLQDPDLRMVAMFAVGAFIMEIPLAYGDYQIYFYRNVFFTGLLIGILLRLPAIDQKIAADRAEAEAARELKSRRSNITRPIGRQVASNPEEGATVRRRVPVGVGAGLAATRATHATELRSRYMARVWDP